MEQKLTFLDNLYNFSLVKYEPKDIILVHKHTKKPYTFHQLNPKLSLHPEIFHPCLCRPILFKNGIIYPRGDSNLFIQLDNKRRSTSSISFSQEELVNTFTPLLQTILHLHAHDIVHGTLSTKSVLFFENGDILVKDWLQTTDPDYYETTSPTFSDDLKAIGWMLAEASCSKGFKEVRKLPIQEIISQIARKYSKSYCYGLIILLKGFHNYSSHVLSLMNNDEQNFKDDMITQIYARCHKPKQITLIDKENPQTTHKLKKQPISQSKLANYIESNSFQSSPTKKFNITTQYKKHPRHDDLQNKKAFNEEVKKRQIQKISKIIERSNAFVNELMVKKNNEKKMKNHSMHEGGSENSNMRKTIIKEPSKLTSPSKRLRTISKKK